LRGITVYCKLTDRKGGTAMRWSSCRIIWTKMREGGRWLTKPGPEKRSNSKTWHFAGEKRLLN